LATAASAKKQGKQPGALLTETAEPTALWMSNFRGDVSVTCCCTALPVTQHDVTAEEEEDVVISAFKEQQGQYRAFVEGMKVCVRGSLYFERYVLSRCPQPSRCKL
jgi:hypothetical protein